MEEYNIGNLFQKIVVKKENAESPTINLVHLDTTNKSEKSDAVMK